MEKIKITPPCLYVKETDLEWAKEYCGDAGKIYINSSSDEDDLVDILTDHGI